MSQPKFPVRPELKKQIIERVRRGEKPIAEIAEEHGLKPQVIYGWLAKGVSAPPTILELSKLKRENKVLLELLGRVTFELSTVKKKEVG